MSANKVIEGVEVGRLKPVKDMVLIEYEKEEKEEKTASGIIMPYARQENHIRIAKILRLSNHCTDQWGDSLKEGDKVYVERYTGIQIKENSQADIIEHALVHYSDILAVIEKE